MDSSQSSCITYIMTYVIHIYLIYLLIISNHCIMLRPAGTILVMLARMSIKSPCSSSFVFKRRHPHSSLMMHTSTWHIYMLRVCHIVLFSLFQCATSRRDTSLHPNYLLRRYNHYGSANRIFAIVVPWSLAKH